MLLPPAALADHGEVDVGIRILTAGRVHYNVTTRNGDKNIRRYNYQLSKDRPYQPRGWTSAAREPAASVYSSADNHVLSLVSMRSRLVCKPPSAERALIRCLTRAIPTKQKSQFYRPTPFRFPVNRKGSLRVYVRL